MSKRTVAILTTFHEFNPGYSLTGIVIDQAHMLLRHGHKVVICVSENYNPVHDKDSGLADLKKAYPESLFVEKKTKAIDLDDYQNDKLIPKHQKQSAEAGQMFFEVFKEYGVSAIFTHDFIFTGWNLPFYHAIKDTSNLMRANMMNSVWLHWVHSVPSGERDWWTLEPFAMNHHIVFPNKTESMRVAESFKVPFDRVKPIPHIKDIRNWYDFCQESRDLIDRYPQIMDAEIMQVYPCSSDRLNAKQLHLVIQIFANMKNAKVPVFLIAANQWATGRQRKEDINKYIEIATVFGLEYGKDFIFTSEVDEKFETGISRRMIRELQLISNVFIFPTREESFGLVGPEAAFSGSLVIGNRSLQMQQEVLSVHAPAFDFGSFYNEAKAVEDPEYIRAVTMAILNRLYSNEAIMTKVYCRTRYHMEALYHRYYQPVIG